ncbi:MAG: hypothetical protein KDA86_13415 [Planctomycetaceae bacterium]|nr:hypothetical protein [Planctomycetaceae bacterium]
MPELHRTQDETRMACHFACGRDGSTGDRAISVNTKADGALFRCFQYGCTTRGNLLHLMFWMKHDHGPSGNRLQGAEFREIASDLQALVRGEDCETITVEEVSSAEPQKPEAPGINVPLKDSENELARALVILDEKYVTDVFRRRGQLPATECISHKALGCWASESDKRTLFSEVVGP